MIHPESKKNLFCKALCLLIAWTAFLSISGGAAAQKPSTVVVVPFKMNADRDLSYLQDGIFDMLSTRLTHPGEVHVVPLEKTRRAAEEVSGPLNESYAKNVGGRLGADFVLFGSLTVFGNSVSVDAKAVDMSGANPPVAFFNQSQGMDEVIPRINEFAAEINRKLFGKQTTATLPAPAPGTAPQASPSQSIYAHPEKMWEQEMGGQAIIDGGGGGPFIVNRPGDVSGFQKSQNFKFEVEGIAAGDLTGDGQNEIVLMESQAVHVYRHQGGRMTELQQIRGEAYHKFISVDAADVKKDGGGRSEIFVTCYNENTKSMDSFVLEWNGSAFDYVSKSEKWYFNVVSHPVLGEILAGQRRGLEDLFLPGVYHLTWDGQGYAGLDTLPVPKGQIVYGFAMGDPLDEGGDMVVSLHPEGHLRVFTAGGGQEWKSDEKYGGSEKFLNYIGADLDESDSRMFLPHPVFIVDSNGDGKNEVLVIKNEALIGRLFKNYRRFGSGTFQALSWDGLGLTPFWQTQKISGYVSDYDLKDMNNDGIKDLVAAVVTKRDLLFRDAKSTVLFYDLSALANKKSAAK